jgi:uncharacterized OB-fold protein
MPAAEWGDDMGIPDFPPRYDDDTVRPFWDAVAQGELHLPACSVCGKWQWYPHGSVACHPEAHLDWRRVAATGTVFTHTTVHRSLLPDGNQTDVPFLTALIEIDGVEGPRLVTALVNMDGRKPAIGMRVRLAPVPRSGFVLPAFEPET